MKRRLSFLILTAIIVGVLFSVPRISYALTTNVKVGFCQYMKPFQYLDRDGNPVGFHIDLFDSLSEERGLVPEYVPFDSTSEAVDALVLGSIDLVLGVSSDQFYKGLVSYSDPLSNVYLSLFAPEGTVENATVTGYGKRIAAENHLTSYSYLSGITSENILLTSNQYEVFRKAIGRRVDAFVGISETGQCYLEDYGLSDYYEIVNNYVAAVDLTIATRKSDRRVTSMITTGLTSLHSSGAYEDIYQKWFADDSVDYKHILNLALAVATIVMLFLLGYAIANNRAKIRLGFEVAARTEELSTRNGEIEQERNLRGLILETTPSSIVFADSSGGLLYMNKNALALCGGREWEPGEPMSNFRIFRELAFYEDTVDAEGDYVAKKMVSDGKTYRYSIHRMTENGEERLLITIDDITAEEREREALFEKEKNETLNSIIAGIAHEIKNPLTTINASASMIETKGDSERFRKAFSQHVPQEINRITRLINNLVDYARPSRGKTETVDVKEVASVVCELATTTSKYVDVTAAFDGESFEFLGDRDKFTQALLNIVLNGIEAVQKKYTNTPQLHYVNINCSRNGETICIKVRDDGIGMDEDELLHCTDPFFTTKKAGTGIGLALTRQSIEEMGGRLGFESVKNEFTEVTITLPALQGREEQ